MYEVLCVGLTFTNLATLRNFEVTFIGDDLTYLHLQIQILVGFNL